jgi:hypothetical protein
MLELDLRLHAPAFTEVIPQVNDRMGDVEAAVGGIVCILGRAGIAIDIVAEEVSRISGFAISSYRKMLGIKG